MDPAVPEVEFVDELLTQSQCAQRGSRTVDEYLIIEFIEFGLADSSAVGQDELVQRRAVPAGKRGINCIGKLAEPMRACRCE